MTDFPKPSDHKGPHAEVLGGCIDLHMHGTCSDGEGNGFCVPFELLDQLKASAPAGRPGE